MSPPRSPPATRPPTAPRLDFKPRLALKLKGGTKRNSHPAFTATFRPRPGNANPEKLSLTLPHSAFLENAHIRTLCTRVQFAAKKCPPGSVYGKARAYTPLLDEPLEGPVYLRSSSNPLPDLVLALHGLVDFNGIIRIDSVNARLRTIVGFIPDVPISKVVVEMQGGKKGLIVNSENLCSRTQRATALVTAHNAKQHKFKPVLSNSCGAKKKRASKRGR